MKVLICGSRDWTASKTIRKYIKTLPKDAIVIQGGATGADQRAATEAARFNLSVMTFLPAWKRYGLAAGPLRNRKMLDLKPDLVVAFHDNLQASKGTLDCVTEARRRGIPVQIIRSDGKETNDSLTPEFSGEAE